MPYVQDPPNTIKIELTKGCNLRCSMCGIAGIQEKQGRGYEFMSLDIAETIAHGIASTGWKSKFEFALRGEPLLNPQALSILTTFRNWLPNNQIMVTSNAIPLLKPPGVEENIQSLFEAGVNILALDDYQASHKATTQVRELAADRDSRVTWTLHDYATGKTEFSPYHRGKKGQRVVIIIEDFEAAAKADKKVGTKHVNNHTGCGSPPLETPLARRCARPFREMVFRANGRVALCCNEWRDYYRIPTIGDETGGLDVAAIWRSAEFNAARKKLMNKDRDFTPCRGCNETTLRDGILPDRMGKFDYDPWTPEDQKALRRASLRGPQETPVLRPWEQPK